MMNRTGMLTVIRELIVRLFAYTNIGVRVFNRIALPILVIYPAMVIVMLIGVSAYVDRTDPFRETVTGLYSWGDKTFRAAPAGLVASFTCEPSSTDLAQAKVSTIRATLKNCKTVYVKQAMDIEAAISGLKSLYGVLLSLSTVSLLCLIAIIGPRRYLGLKKPAY
jgi:hypothetical protein